MDEWEQFKLQVREASDIAGVVGERLTLKSKGRELVGLCPFHDDHNPSMAVIPSKDMFWCPVCGAGGDVFTFVQRYHGIEFIDALRMLADRAGLEPPKRTSSNGRSDTPNSPSASRQDVVSVNGLAARYFQALLSHPEHGRAARELIARRGISDAMVERFGIGAAADRWDGLKTMAERSDWDVRSLVAAGLLKRKDNADHLYDGLRNRLIFPIHGESGDVIAFGARRIDDADDPKYLNSPDTPAFKKSTALFGLPHARNAIRREDTAVVVEGYTDVIACHQAGVEHVVGTLGTAFTSEHARKLRGLCARVVLLFDGDEAGQHAADRAFEVVLASKVDVGVAVLSSVTDAKDPDELLKRDGGAEQLRRALEAAEHVVDFWGRRLAAKLAGAGPGLASRTLEDELRRLADLGLTRMSPMERRLLLERLAAASGVPQTELLASLPSGRSARSQPIGARADADPDRPLRELRVGRLEDAEYMVGCLLAEPALIERLNGVDIPDPTDPRVTAILHVAQTASTNGRPIFDDPEIASAAATLEQRATEAAGEEPQAVETLFNHLLNKFRDASSSDASPEVTVADRLAALRARGGVSGASPYGRRKPRA